MSRFPRSVLIVVLAALPVGAAGPALAISPSDMDTSAQPCHDFYTYADGGWLKANPVPPAYSRWGSFTVLADHNREILRGILEEAAAKKASAGSDEQKIGNFYAACMDETKIEAEGSKPIQPDLDRIAKIADRAALEAEIARLHVDGVPALFAFGSQQDRKNSEEVIAGVFQGGLGLPDRDYYVKDDDKTKTIRDQYVAHVGKMMALLGDDAATAAAEGKTVLDIETRLAKASMTRVERRDPDATYHRMSVAELQKLTPNFAWDAYLKEVDAPPSSVNVGQPAFLETVNRELDAVPLADWKTYLRWHLVADAAPALSSPFVQEDFDFNGRILNGTKEILPRWKRCVAATDDELGFALGHKYVDKAFPPESKARMDTLVKNLIAVLREDLATLPWMGEATRKAAIEKLAAFTPKIGYPDEWRDYSAYRVGRDSYAENVRAGNAFEFHRQLAKIGKPVDRKEWGMTPPTVNAYYNPLKNEIVFPAGILQPPFFDGKADDAVNYGAIGAVIGHEMTHGFDDQGRKFDAHGNLRDWWTPEDAKNYEARAACVEKQFDGYVVQEGLHENGKLVLGESIADLGGLTIAWKAYQKSLAGKPEPAKIDGFTAGQRFYLSFARVWAENDRPESERLQVVTNPHPLDRFRAIAAPSNMPQFANAFGCQAGDPMVRAERCAIW
ncbi:MAG TPA: M13 family metallopeptidase [Thermoanaerobaculia bacterium]|nr:M13 family metallopeptidase [Thermoanaerobaculia bacterium]